jgi:hypothetical protein
MLRKSYYIEMDIKLLELYSDYIISSFGQITATGLSKALEFKTIVETSQTDSQRA